jgi:hypothetical protein
MITADDLGDIDREALERALKLCAAQDAGRAEQIAAMLDERSWAETGHFAAASCQRRALRLSPWQSPPSDCLIEPLNPQDAPARRLLRRMLNAGLSRFEPSPLGALERAKVS